MSETLSEEHENEGGDQILEGKIPRDMCFGSFFKCLHGLKRLLSDGNGSKEFVFFHSCIYYDWYPSTGDNSGDNSSRLYLTRISCMI